MTLKEHVESKPFFRAKRGLGRESEWLGLCDLALTGGVLYVFDPGVLPGQGAGITIPLSTGLLAVSGKVITYWKDSRISRLRAVLQGTAPALGKRTGSVATDLGLVGLADQASYTAAWELNNEAFQHSLSAEIPEAGCCKVAKFGAPPGVVIPFVESGFGDGRYSVYALEDQGKRVGAEVVFIKPDQVYPF